MLIRPATRSDRAAWLELRAALWPGYPREQLEREVDQLLDALAAGGQDPIEPHEEAAVGQAWGVFVAVSDDGTLLAFVECSLRSRAPACESDRIGYLEGWFVLDRVRGQGVGRALAERGERWACEQGSTEMASDTTSEYPLSPAAHAALGYELVHQCIDTKQRYYFRKSISG